MKDKTIVESFSTSIKTDYKKHIKEHKDFPIKGVNYLDFNPLYQDADIRRKLTKDSIDLIRIFKEDFDYIGVIESRGFLIGSMIADRLHKGLVLLRSKPNRLPGKTSKVKHTLEYGDAQMEVQNGKGKVLIFDDVLATGGTIGGAVEVLTKAGYKPTSALFLAELEFLEPKIELNYGSVIKYGKV